METTEIAIWVASILGALGITTTGVIAFVKTKLKKFMSKRAEALRERVCLLVDKEAVKAIAIINRTFCWELKQNGKWKENIELHRKTARIKAVKCLKTLLPDQILGTIKWLYGANDLDEFLAAHIEYVLEAGFELPKIILNGTINYDTSIDRFQREICEKNSREHKLT